MLAGNVWMQYLLSDLICKISIMYSFWVIKFSRTFCCILNRFLLSKRLLWMFKIWKVGQIYLLGTKATIYSQLCGTIIVLQRSSLQIMQCPAKLLTCFYFFYICCFCVQSLYLHFNAYVPHNMGFSFDFAVYFYYVSFH